MAVREEQLELIVPLALLPSENLNLRLISPVFMHDHSSLDNSNFLLWHLCHSFIAKGQFSTSMDPFLYALFSFENSVWACYFAKYSMTSHWPVCHWPIKVIYIFDETISLNFPQVYLHHSQCYAQFEGRNCKCICTDGCLPLNNTS